MAACVSLDRSSKPGPNTMTTTILNGCSGLKAAEKQRTGRVHQHAGGSTVKADYAAYTHVMNIIAALASAALLTFCHNLQETGVNTSRGCQILCFVLRPVAATAVQFGKRPRLQQWTSSQADQAAGTLLLGLCSEVGKVWKEKAVQQRR